MARYTGIETGIITGRMDRRITLNSCTQGVNAIGEPTETYASAGDCWAEVIESGLELWRVQQIHAQVNAIFKIRYRTDIGPKWTITYAGRTYDIESIEEIGRQRGLLVLAKSFNRS